MSRIISVINQKGGVGKTTTVVNLGAALTKLNKKVLLIDMDPQANLSFHLGYSLDKISGSIYNVLKGEKCAKDILVKREEGIHLLPSTLDLSGAEIELINEVGRESILKRSISELINDYDYIFIDCPPSLGLLTLNALTASKEIFIPIQAEFLALYGMSKLLEMIDIVKKRINKELSLTGIIIVMFDKRKNLAKEVVENIKRHFDKIIFKTYIRENVSLAEAPAHQKTIFEYAKSSYGAYDYFNLAKEIDKM